MIALASRDSSSHQACEIKHAADEICRAQSKKVGHAFQQRVNEIDGYKEREKNEKGTMIPIIMRFVVDDHLNVAFSRKEEK